MLAKLRYSLSRNFSSVKVVGQAVKGVSVNIRQYHSYPDPNEKPIIKTTQANHTKTYDKNSPEFQLNPKFKMDKLFPGTPISSGIGTSPPPPTLYTRLDNGLIVASQEIPGMMTSAALIVRTGSAYEEPDETGVTHFLELNAFRSTKHRTHEEVISQVEQLGGMVQCIASRENIIYVIDVMRHEAQHGFDILADTVINPIFPDEELNESRDIVTYQQNELPSEIFSRDLLQRAAYQNSPLSNHHYCPIDNINNINSNILNQFRSKHYYTGNCILAVAGMDHETAIKYAQKSFQNLPILINNNDKKPYIRKSDGLDTYKPSVYTGGMLTQTRELKEPFVKLAMGFEIGGWNDDLLVPICVLQQLLGGGSSFSAGGPGKGMYTRLYTQVLNRNYWTESVESFVSIHENTGILGIDGACSDDKLVNLIQVIMQQFTILAIDKVNDIELNRAKNMLKSSMMMQLESRLVQCEDIARQFITYNKRDTQLLMCQKIDAVTAEDIIKVAQLMLTKKPSIGVVGHNLSYLPTYSQIEEYCKNYYEQARKTSTTGFL